ncbi:MAG: leucyl/phenylalanyl-tRNA--protein transferase [Myxococcales bacterium]|nr:leucyl/phenylalanyl-tRNA--protein transferase [Myxococcales bacterium]
MPVYVLGPDPELFPAPQLADDSGLLAIGGDLSARRLLAAYSQGIFPWPAQGLPLLWHSPDPRFVLEPGELHIPRSLRKVIRCGAFEVRLDTAFEQVIAGCARVRRRGQRGTWITPEMRSAYCELHHLGYAHSAESWAGGELQGGLYGVSLGSAFFGESMFARAPDASKVAFVQLVQQLAHWGFSMVDCQQETEHLARFGATGWPRERFLAELGRALLRPTRRGPWKLAL